MVKKAKTGALHRCGKESFFTLTGILLLAGTVLGAWTIVGHTVNILTMAAYRTEIDEKYQAPSALLPSQRVEKMVNVKNTGQTDAFIRVKVDKAFGDIDEEGCFAADTALDTDVIRISFDQTGAWTFAEDGYWYYTQVLKAGETTRVPLMDSYVLSPAAGNEYKGKQGRIIIRMESVQAEGEAVAEWRADYKDLGLVYEKAVSESRPAGVTFTGRDEGFVFDTDHADLFTGFKALTPGCTRTQTVVVENAYKHAVRILLQGIVLQQEQMPAEELALVKKLLSEAAYITIREGEKILYDGPVDGNPEGTGDGKTLSRPISLGGFAPGEKKKLVISLRVGPEMEAGERALMGKVGWDFLAEGDDTWKGDYPYTGDNSPTAFWILILACAALAGAGALAAVRRRRRGGK